MTFARTAIDGGNANPSATTIATAGYTSVSGRLIAGYVAWEGGNTTVSVADTAGNTYVVGTPVPHGVLPDQVIASFYCLSSAGNASNVITATFGAARSARTIQSAEYSNSAAAIFDGSAYGECSGAATATTGNIVTTGAVGLLFAGTKAYNSTTITAGGSLTLIAQQGPFGGDADRLLTSAGTYTAEMTNNSSSSLSLVALAFKEGTPNPTVSTVSSNSATEGSAITHTVTLSGATNQSTNYAATLVGVTATGSGTDFTSALGSATYSNGVTFSGGNMVVPTAVSSFTVGIATTSDTTDEVDETYTLTVGGVSGTGTITDDDAPPTISVTDASENAMQVVFTVSLSQASGKSITVDYATANGTKTAGTDYTAASGSLTFAAGETSKTVTVAVL